jgi:nitrate reductase NapE component
MKINNFKLSDLPVGHFLNYKDSCKNREKIFQVYNRIAQDKIHLPLEFFSDRASAEKLQAAVKVAQLKKNAILFSMMAFAAFLIALSAFLIASGYVVVPIIILTAGPLELIPIWYFRDAPFDKGTPFDKVLEEVKEELKPIIERTAVDWLIEFIKCKPDQRKEKVEEAKRLLKFLEIAISQNGHPDREHEMFPLYDVADSIVSNYWHLRYEYFLRMYRDRKKEENPEDVGLSLALYNQGMQYEERLYNIWHNNFKPADHHPHDFNAKGHYERIHPILTQYREGSISSKDFSAAVYPILKENKMVKWSIDPISGEDRLEGYSWQLQDLDDKRRIFTALVSV